MGPSSVLVIVLNYNAGPPLEECLRSLQATTYPEARIVVIDNGSTDGSIAVPGRLGIEVHPYGENLGYCAAYNRAFRELIRDEDFVLLSNPDLIVPPETIGRMADAASKDETIGFVGPLQRHADTRGIRSAGIRWACGGLPQHVTNPGGSIDAVEGAFLLVRRAVLERVGGLDEAFALNLEDIEWQLRARRAGFRSVLAADVSILHQKPGSNRVVSGAYYQTRNALYITQKLCPPAAVRRLERRLKWEGRIGLLLGSPRAPEILNGIADFHAGVMGMRRPPSDSPGR